VSESRTSKRFSVQLPIRVHPPHSKRELRGFTANVSAAGIFLQAPADLAPGSRIKFEITLPADAVGAEQDVEIRGTGRVVRVDSQTHGVACVIDRYQFVRSQE
jgi:hypothetical protein